MKINISIEGMHCGGCVNSVMKALLSVPGVDEAAVDLAHAKAETEGAMISGADIFHAVEAAGFDAKLVD